MIGGSGAHGLEEFPPLFEGAQVAAPGGGVFAGEGLELAQVFSEAGELGIDDGIGPEGGDDAPFPL